MKKMKNSFVAILLITAMLTSTLGIAFADEFWICEKCGAKCTGNFCSNCGAAKPGNDKYGNASAGIFTIRNGIQFGMTRAQVEAREKDLKYIGDVIELKFLYGIESPVIQYFGLINGEETTLKYIFGGKAEELTSVLYEHKGWTSDKKAKQVYTSYVENFTQLYGERLGLKNGKVSSLMGLLFSLNINYPTFNIQDYDEWVIENEDRSCVKVELLRFSSGSYYYVHAGFTYFTESEVRKMLKLD